MAGTHQPPCVFATETSTSTRMNTHTNGTPSVFGEFLTYWKTLGSETRKDTRSSARVFINSRASAHFRCKDTRADAYLPFFILRTFQ